MQFSIEFSPPKDITGMAHRCDVILSYIEASNPRFISLTCGAGGTESRKDLAFQLIDFVRDRTEVPIVAHLPHAGRSRTETMSLLREFRDAGAEMVLALRGDPPKGQVYQPHPDGFLHTADFVSDIKQLYPEMPVYVAGYPEIHPDSPSIKDDIEHLNKKITAGAEMVLEQFCLDDRIAPNWHKACVEDYRIKVPLVPVVISMQTPSRVFAMSEQCNVFVPEWVREEFKHKENTSMKDRAKKACDFMRAQLSALQRAGEEYVHICGLNSPTFPQLLAEFLDGRNSFAKSRLG